MKKNIRIFLVTAAALEASCAIGALKYGLDAYVQDGLVVHLDGFCNAGRAAAHDAQATVWANLADAANPANIKGNGASGWRDDGYFFAWDNASSYARLAHPVPAMTAATFEFAVRAEKGDQRALSWGCTFFSGTNDQRVCTVDANGQIRFKADQWTGSSNYRPSIANWGWKQAAFTLGSSGEGNFKAYDAGVPADAKSAGETGTRTIPATDWMVGSRIDLEDGDRQFIGVFQSMRIYNRALTAAEVAWNATVDAARFEGRLPVTNAVIATSVDGVAGTEAPGVYAVDGVHVFTVPPAVTRAAVTYVCTGHTREIWTDGDWGAPVHVNGFSATVSEDETVRITWQWAVATGVLGDGIEAYSTDGIKVWYDGIRNVGKDKPHADEGVWHELVSGLPANMTTNANCRWMRDGYYFAVGPGGAGATGAMSIFGRPSRSVLSERSKSHVT